MQQELLSEQELCFLLDASRPAPEDPHAEDDPEVSEEEDKPSSIDPSNLSGDLSEIKLADILHTVSRTGMEGVIVVANALDEHHLWVLDGNVADWMPSRVESRRMGQRLARAGVLTQEQVEEAITDRAAAKIPFGQYLVAEGLATHRQIEEATDSQALEDIYSLFVWTEGTVEFREGPPGDDEQGEPQEPPTLDIDEVLAEVKERKPDWQPILNSLGSLNEVLVAQGDGRMLDLEAHHQRVLDAVDGQSSLLDLAHHTMLGLFDCAHAVKDLFEWRMVGVAPTQGLLSMARDRVKNGDRRKALALLNTLIKRDDLVDIKDICKTAELLSRCKEKLLASEFLLTSAYARDSLDDRVELASQASRIATRSVKVLAYYRDRLLEAESPTEHVRDVSCSLADVMIRDGWVEEALEVLKPFPVVTEADCAAASLRVRALCKLGRNDEAVEQLLAMAELNKTEDKRAQLHLIYQQILRIDGTRSDIEAALQSFDDKRKLPWIPIAAGAAVVVLLGLWLLFSDGGVDQERYQEWTKGVRAKMNAGEMAAAMSILDEGDLEFGRLAETRSLREEIDRLVASEREKREEAFLSQLTKAADLLDAGKVKEAVGLYRTLRTSKDADRVDRVVKARFEVLTQTLHEQAKALAPRVPVAPSSLATEQEILAVLDELEATFKPGVDALPRLVLASDQALLADMLGEEVFERLSAAANKAADVHALASARMKAYETASGRAKVRRQLERLWRAGKEHEEAFNIAKAHEVYEQLAREYPDGEDGLRTVFAGKRARYASILGSMTELEQATEKGDLKEATRLLEDLKLREPTVPFGRLVRLPLRIVTSPPAASVVLDGKEIGNTPLLTSYRPSDQPILKVELNGFQPVQHKLRRQSGTLLNIVLTRAAAWKSKAQGVVDRRSEFSSDGMLYVVDRSGRIMAFERNSGEKLWTVSTGDLSGLLSTPVVWQDRIVVASLDGPVRCFDRKTAKLLWERDNLPSECSPVVIDDVVYLATIKGELLALDPAVKGRTLNKAALPGRAHGDMSVSESRIYLTTRDGWVVCADGSKARRGAVAWKTRVGSGIETAPYVSPGLVAVGSSEGKLIALNPSTGAQLWARVVTRGEQMRGPVIVDSRVIVAVRKKLLSFDVKTGKPAEQLEGREDWSAAPVVVDGNVLIGDRRGLISVFGVRPLRLNHQLRGDKAVAGPVTKSADGWLAVGFEDRTLRCYLPQ